MPPTCVRLFAYLLTRPGRRATRAHLMELVSDDACEQAARRRLNTAVWRLRGAFEDCEDHQAVVVSEGTGLAIATGCDAWVDVDAFDRACKVSRPVREWTRSDADAFRRGMAYYAGEFLDGVYDDWALAERSRLADLHVLGLLRMVRWHEQEDEPEAALEYAQAAASTDPLREDLQRLLMRQYRRAGLPEMAVHHYETCRALLAAELGVDPLPETRDAGLGRDAAAVSFAVPSATRAVREVLHELESTRDELRTITEQVEHSITALRSQLTSAQGGTVTGG